VKRDQRTADTTSTVFVVDDDAGVRDAVAVMLRVAGRRVRCFSSGASFLETFDPALPGCLILDVKMPGLSGLALQQELGKRGSDMPIVFITGHGDVPMSVQAMKAGAVDFLEKPFDKLTLLRRVEEALQADQARRDQRRRTIELQQRYHQLTPREREVMAHVVRGEPNKGIASQMRLSHRTVEIHRSRVMEKMQAHSLPELVSMAVSCGVHALN
jgi:FixJ family two-component response regulator